MKTLRLVVIFAILVAGAALGGFWIGRRHGADEKESASAHDAQAPEGDEAVKPVAEVKTEPARLAEISETITVYGSIVAQSGDVRILSVPFESRVVKVLATTGQQVGAGADVIQVEASPDALIALQEAKNSLAVAEKDVARVQERFKEHLATNSELAQAEQALQSGKLKLESLTQRGVGAQQTLKTLTAGIISKIDVQEGQIVPTGGPLVEIASGKSIEASIGVEPEDAAYLKPGQVVQLQPVGRAPTQPERGTIRLVAQRVDPVTRLTNVLVTLPPNTQWMLESFVAGKIIKSSATGLVVPRDAVLPEEDGGYALFTIKNGRASRHAVRAGLQNDREMQVIVDDVKPGERVITLGNYELEDGMEVTTEPAATRSAASAPATQETEK